MMFQLIVEPGGSPILPTEGASSITTVAIVGLGFIVIVALAVAFRGVMKAMTRPEMHGLDRKKVIELWAEIIKTSEQGLMGAKLAVIEGDRLVDGAMRSMMIPGETMGERLKAARYKYPNIERVWSAHKLRNQLSHDPTFQISLRQAKGALADFESALKTLNVL